jgi:hypothetical protein
MIDNLILVCEGNIVYNGDMKLAKDYFARNG